MIINQSGRSGEKVRNSLYTYSRRSLDFEVLGHILNFVVFGSMSEMPTY